MKLLKYVCVFTIVLSFSLSANEKLTNDDDIIFWQTYHRPPDFFLTGPNEGTGFIQQVLKHIIEKLPEYDHEMKLTTLARAIRDIKFEKTSCHPALVKSAEREEFMYFSKAAIFKPTNRIIAKKDFFDDYLRDGGIDLREITEHKNFTFALIKGRSFTPDIDGVLAQYLNKENRFIISNTDLSPTFEMIELGRVDATIAYPFEFNYYTQHHQLSKQRLETYPILGSPLFSIGYVACPKNEWGKKVITKINAALEELKPTKVFKDAFHSGWQSDQDNPSFEAFYQNEFLIR
jgi:uncharacterized protein (TIGR02285 family)